jgi:hypothetical protein
MSLKSFSLLSVTYNLVGGPGRFDGLRLGKTIHNRIIRAVVY